MKYSHLLRIITPPKATLALIVLLMLADSVVALALPWLAGRVTETLLGPQPGAVAWLLLAWLGLGGLKALAGLASGYLSGATGENMSARLRARVYEHLQSLPMAYFQNRKQGQTLALLTRDAEGVAQFITHTLVQVLPHAVTFFGAFVLMTWLDPLIAALAVLVLPFYFLAMKLIGRGIRPVASNWIESWSRMYAFTEENLGLMPAIKAFVREPLERLRFDERNRELNTLSKRQLRAQAVLSASVGFLATAGLVALVWIGAQHVQAGQLDAAGLVSLLLYAMLMARPLAALAGVYGQVQQTRGAAERLLDCFSEHPEPGSERGQALTRVAGAVRFEGVSFAYPGRPAAVQDIDLDITAGETLGIVGPNGAGKSTLAWLLMRFADPSQGRISVDGTDIREVTLSSLRHQVGLVPQHTLLLNASVSDNIAYGVAGADAEAVRAAARAAGAAEFIEALPEGYDTLIGDQGVRLSGGQRQRLSLARTLLKDPPIIVLDEATSMFDPQGEADFLAECAALLAGRTVIMITHRPVSLAIADRVIEMRTGRLVV